MLRHTGEHEAVEQLRRTIAAARRDPHGGKVLLPFDVAEALLKALRQ